MESAPENDRPFGEFDLDRQVVKANVAEGLFGARRSPVRRGRFELIRRCGQGAMGMVYEAIDLSRGERVALKLLTRLDATAIQRLKREFRSLSALDHPNLVRLDALFHEDGEWFFSMELVQGEPFDTFTRGPGCDPESLRACVRQVVEAVLAIHAAGKLHRDLKPSNVLVTESGHVVVLDFGLVVDEQLGGQLMLTRSEIVGTPAYMAPELVTSHSATRSSDWYAVGVMLFEILTGQLPFGGNPLRVLQEKQNREAPDPRALSPDAPDDLCEIALQLLQRTPEARWDGQQVLQRLHRAEETCAPEFGLSRRSVPNVFVGRESELGILQDALGRVRAGETVSVLLHGASGVGKSALLERFAESCSDSRTLVLRGRCHQQESLPYKVFDGIMDALGQRLKRMRAEDASALLPRHAAALLQLFPALEGLPSTASASARRARPADARELRNQAFAALREMLLRLSDRATLVIAVDDLQWGDIDSAHMLRAVLGPPDPPAVLFLGTYRTDEATSSEFLHAILGEDGDPGRHLEQLELRPLQTAAASQMLRELLGAEDGQSLDALAAEAAGVPFFIAELARHVIEGGSAEPTAGAGFSLERLILARVASLPADAQRLLHVLSVAAAPLELDIAAEAAGLARGARATLLSLRSARLLRLRLTPSAELAETYHDRIRETVTASLSEPERCNIHRTIADALQRHAIADPERLVTHYLGAGDRVRAGETAVEAGVAASQKLAFNHAVQLFRRALTLLPLPGHSAIALHRYLGDALANAGRGGDAGDAYLQAAGDAPADQAQQLRALAAVQYLGSPRMQEGMHLARSVLGDVGIQLPEKPFAAVRAYTVQRTLLRVRTWRPRAAPDPARIHRLDMMRDVSPGVSWVDPMGGLILQARYMREALEENDLDHMLHAVTTEAVTLAVIGGARNERKAGREVARLRDLADRVGTPYAKALVDLVEANRLLWSGRFYGDALERVTRAKELLDAEPGPLPWERTSVAVIQSIALGFTGEMRKLKQLFAEQERDLHERDNQFVSMMLTSSNSQSYMADDRPEAAIALLNRMRDAVPLSDNFRYTWWVRMTDALTYCGRTREAFETSEFHWPELRKSYIRYGEFMRNNALYFRARTALAHYLQSDDPKALAIARRATSELPDNESSHGGCRATLTASLRHARGDLKEAIAMMQLGRDRFRACQAYGDARLSEYCLQRLWGDDESVARLDEAFKTVGVLNPPLWVQTYIPMRG